MDEILIQSLCIQHRLSCPKMLLGVGMTYPKCRDRTSGTETFKSTPQNTCSHLKCLGRHEDFRQQFHMCNQINTSVVSSSSKRDQIIKYSLLFFQQLESNCWFTLGYEQNIPMMQFMCGIPNDTHFKTCKPLLNVYAWRVQIDAL